jgi:hypothetical protein
MTTATLILNANGTATLTDASGFPLFAGPAQWVRLQAISFGYRITAERRAS